MASPDKIPVPEQPTRRYRSYTELESTARETLMAWPLKDGLSDMQIK